MILLRRRALVVFVLPIVLAALAVQAEPAFAQTIGAIVESGVPGLSVATLLRGNVGTVDKFGIRGSSVELGTAISYSSLRLPFSFGVDLRAISDDRYTVSRAFLDSPVYFFIHEAGIGFDGDPLSGRAGRFPHYDVVKSPYSLFVSSRGNSAFLYEIDYEGEWVRFLTRSVELSRNSVFDSPEKSVVFQTVAIRRPRWEVGFQDATVAVPPPESNEDPPQTSDGSGPVFVPELFFSPLPGYMTQYIIGGGESLGAGAPWVQDFNYKSLMGFYGVLRGGEARLPWEVEAQILVDDFNANAIMNPDGNQNPFIGAWMLSGIVDTDYGNFRLSHAGSLMYTFQTSHNRNYGYTYYPYTYFERNGEQTIDYRDNYFGFFLGDNTLAFRLDWDRGFPVGAAIDRTIGVEAGLEYTVSGSKSPANQWGDLDHWSDHNGDGAFGSTRLLDEDRLEHGLALHLAGEYTYPLRFGSLRFGLDGTFGVWFNVLRRDRAADSPDDPRGDLYRPSDETYRKARFGVWTMYSF